MVKGKVEKKDKTSKVLTTQKKSANLYRIATNIYFDFHNQRGIYCEDEVFHIPYMATFKPKIIKVPNNANVNYKYKITNDTGGPAKFEITPDGTIRAILISPSYDQLDKLTVTDTISGISTFAYLYVPPTTNPSLTARLNPKGDQTNTHFILNVFPSTSDWAKYWAMRLLGQVTYSTEVKDGRIHIVYDKDYPASKVHFSFNHSGPNSYVFDVPMDVKIKSFVVCLKSTVSSNTFEFLIKAVGYDNKSEPTDGFRRWIILRSPEDVNLPGQQ